MPSAQRLAWVLTGLALLAALIAMFGPREPWRGVDLDAIATTVFVLSLLALVALSYAKVDEIFPEHMSLAERRNVVGLFFIGIILAGFIRQLWELSIDQVEAPRFVRFVFSGQFAWILYCSGFGWILIDHHIERQNGDIQADERDLRLRHRANRAGNTALVILVVVAIYVLKKVPASRLEWWLTPLVLANLLVGLLIAKFLVEQVALAIVYRRA